MEKRTKVRIVAVLYLILGVSYIVLGWNAKQWYPSMFASNTYYGEWVGTNVARVLAIIVGVFQVLIGYCLIRGQHGDALALNLILCLGSWLFTVGFCTSGDDPSFHKVSGDDDWWFLNYFVLTAVHVLFGIFLTHGRKPEVGARTMTR